MTETTARNATDIIIPVYNQYSFTRNLIESIYRHTDVPFHIYLIDPDLRHQRVGDGRPASQPALFAAGHGARVV